MKLLNIQSVIQKKEKFCRYIWIGFWLLLISCPKLLCSDSVTTDFKPNKLIRSLYKQHSINIYNNSIVVTPRWFVPDHYRLQYAGNIGFGAIGTGYSISKLYEITFYYGLLNISFGDTRAAVNTLSIKNSFNIISKPLAGHFKPKIGLSINWGNTHNTFKKLPDHYPRNYYFQNKIHLAPFWGGEWQHTIRNKTLKQVGAYFEFSTLDAYLIECLRNRFVHITDIWSLCFGLSFYIH